MRRLGRGRPPRYKALFSQALGLRPADKAAQASGFWILTDNLNDRQPLSGPLRAWKRHQTDTPQLQHCAIHPRKVINRWGDFMPGKVLHIMGRAHLVLLVIVFSLLICEPGSRKYGDRLQIVLPTVAWACAAMNGSALEYAARFTAMLVVTHTSKSALGLSAINQRPSGGSKGFPSAHTSAAAFGASSLVYECLGAHPAAKAMIVMAAAFVGGSRIEAQRHTIWQVLAGGLLGWGADRTLRKHTARQRLGAAWRHLRLMLAERWPAWMAAARTWRTNWSGRVAPAARPVRNGANQDTQAHSQQ